MILVFLVCCSTIVTIGKMDTYINYINYNEVFNEPVRVEEYSKRKHAGCASFEYLPTKAYENYSYIVTRTKEAIVTKGKANLGEFIKNNGVGNVDIITSEQDTILELPYIYYLGYEITLINNEQKEVLKYNESENGFIEVKLPNNVENSKIQVKYTGTILTKISYVLSLVGVVILLVILVKADKQIK